MNKLFPPFLENPAAIGLLVVRVVAGLALMLHGYGKIQNPFGWMGPDSWAPGILQALAAVAEFGGGLALILGLLTPIACAGIICVMLVAIFGVHVPKGDPFVGKGGSYELASLYFSIATALLFTGPGALSLDAKFFRKLPLTTVHVSEREKTGTAR
ncbi:MAG: DoxX family protein [Cyanobacteria bacterium]|nr:DoxX family protein [Cyanobacteriota bacterium]